MGIFIKSKNLGKNKIQMDGQIAFINSKQNFLHIIWTLEFILNLNNEVIVFI